MIQQLRKRIERCRRDLARVEGEIESLKKQISSSVKELGELLDCSEGEYQDAVRTLKESIVVEEQELSGLMDEAESLMDGNDDGSE